METDTTESAEEMGQKSKVETKIETQAVIEHNPCTSTSHTNNEETNQSTEEVFSFSYSNTSIKVTFNIGITARTRNIK